MSAYQAGIAVGFLAVIIVVLLVVKFTNKCTPNSYDERQLLERGNAYKWGFFTFIAEACLAIAFSMAEVNLSKFVEPGLFYMFGLFIPIIVFACYSITKDALVGIATSNRRSYIIYIVVFVINLVTSIQGIMEGSIIENGVLTYRCTNILCALFFGFVLVAMYIKNHSNKSEE